MKKNILFLSLIFLTKILCAQHIYNFENEKDELLSIPKNIQNILKKVTNGDIIEFPAGNYDFNNEALTINKQVTLRGVHNNSITLPAKGADNTTIGVHFTNCKIITFRSDNIKIHNISLTKTSGTKWNIFLKMFHPTYTDRINGPGSEQNLETNDSYTGIEFNNVKIAGGGYQIAVGNGIGGSFTNVTFENFNVIGFWFNRIGNSNSHPKVTWTNCTFSPKNVPNGTSNIGNTIEFNDRAISFDAGNASYPIVWDHNNSTIENCNIINTGFGASSRGANVIINNNVFNDNSGKVDLIHIEEFSSNFTITNNTFNCTSDDGSKIMVFDRELQPVKNINVSNNIVTGLYRFFISAYGTSDLNIENNNFTESSATVSGNRWINLAYYENEIHEPIIPRSNPNNTGDLPSENIVIKNNIGLERAETGSLSINLKQGTSLNSEGNDINFPRASDISFIESPRQLLAGGTYEIVNAQTGQVLTAKGSNGEVITSDIIDNSSKWIVTFAPPFSYNFQNLHTNNFLELAVPFTESNIIGNPNNLPELFPFEKNNYSEMIPSFINRLPFWCLTKEEDHYVILPGGNEKQSAIATLNDEKVTLVAAKKKNPNDGSRLPVELNNNAKWKFRLTDENFITLANKEDNTYSFGEETQQQIHYGVRADNEILESIEIDLAILNTKTKTIVAVEASQLEVVNQNATSNGTETFNYTIPTGITASNKLSDNEVYILRSTLNTKVNGIGETLKTKSEIQITLFELITENKITWDNPESTLTIGANSEQTITHAILEKDTPQFTQFGLLIIDTNANIIEVIKPQSFPSTAANIEQRGTTSFNYLVPENITPSNELPEGQSYVIRTRISSLNENGMETYATQNTTVNIIKGNSVTWVTNHIKTFAPDGETSQKISYNVQEDETIKLIQFGLIITDLNNNYVSAVTPQTNVAFEGDSSIANSSATIEFDFKTPTGISTSDQLPVGQKYRMRTRIDSKDNDGKSIVTLNFEDVSILNPGFSFINWDTKATNKLTVNETSNQKVSYRVQQTDHISLVQFSLLLRTENNNAFIQEVIPKAIALNGNALIEDTIEFDFNIPIDITISEDLPDNQKYTIRTRVVYTDGNNVQAQQTEFTDITILESNQLSVPNNVAQQSKTVLYPNPASNTINLLNAGTGNYYILDMLGNRIDNFSINRLDSKQNSRHELISINIEQLKTGIYYIQNENGNALQFIKR